MSDVNNSIDKKSRKQAAAELVKTLAHVNATPETGTNLLAFVPDFEPRVYDSDKVGEFLDLIFPDTMAENENVVTCVKKPTSKGWYACSEDELFTKLESKAPKSLYYSTSTFNRDPVDGKLYHRQSLFAALNIIVLDDVGTKVPFDKIPATFQPTYKLETSKGNFQWGYVLAEPVRNFEAASALVQLVYESGASDEGGKMPNKWVRMPEGINGKEGREGFISTLTESNPKNVYTPQEIIDALNLNADWDEILQGATTALKKRGGTKTGASLWSPIAAVASALNGFIDPVLEWCYDMKMVLDDRGGEWVDVICPWHEEHSDGNPTAGYLPLGRNSTDVTKRTFHCFHGCCANRNTVDFLQFVATNDGPEAGIYDPSAELTSRYVFDAVNNIARDTKSVNRNLSYILPAFSNMYPHSVNVMLSNGKEKKVSQTALWRNSKAKVVVHGSTFNASTNARIVEDEGMLKYNLFGMPEWGKGAVIQRHVDTFLNFLTYLVPNADDRQYFISTIAAKAQDMSFRGTAIIMVGERQGLGRSTLADMLMTLYGRSNCESIELKDMLGESGFNEWRARCFVVVEEAKASSGTNKYDTYERLKTYVDPRNGKITINPKYGMKYEVYTQSSFLLLSNHINAVAIPEGDRRFYVMRNALTPATPRYFGQLNAWLAERDTDGQPSWARSVYRWLLQQPVSIEELTAPPPVTEAKGDMTSASASNLDFAVQAAIDIWPSIYICSQDIKRVLEHPILQKLEYDDKIQGRYVVSRVAANSKNYDHAIRSPDHPHPVRPRVLHRDLAAQKHVPFYQLDTAALIYDLKIRKLDFDAVALRVAEIMAENDR